jgi:hypothetical protein
MTRKEHFERFMKHRFPYASLEYNDKGDCYKGDVAFVAHQAWKESPLRRPTENSKITKEQLAAMKADDPATIVDRLNGIFGNAVEPYPVPNVQKEAVREILRLREAVARLGAK